MAVKKKRRVICPYCREDAELVDSSVIYQTNYDTKLWVCWPCDARVGIHRGSKDNAPMGRLANKVLRQAKMRAHEAFDPLWKQGRMTRAEAYKWLAHKMGIAVAICHIGYFDLEQCNQVVAIMADHKELIP